MTQAAVPPGTLVRGAPWGADGIFYPAEEEPDVPLGDDAMRLILYLYVALNRVFAGRADAYVGADQNIYWERGNRDRRIAPDGYVLFGVPKRPLRSVIRIWEEAPPAFVAEISSVDSRADDRGRKLELYRDALQVPEYLIYDLHNGELLLFRREAGQYARQAPDARGRLHSRELGVSFGPDEALGFRVYGPDGEPLPCPEELYADFGELQEHRDMLAGIASRLEEEARELRERYHTAQRRAEEQERRAEEQRVRADALEAELKRLREQRGQ